MLDEQEEEVEEEEEEEVVVVARSGPKLGCKKYFLCSSFFLSSNEFALRLD